MEIAIRTKKFDVFFTCFKTLKANCDLRDYKLRIIATTMRSPEKYPERNNISQYSFLRDKVLFEEFAKNEKAELEFIYIDDIKDRLPNNKNIFPFAIYRSLINSKNNEVFSLDDDIFYIKPDVLKEISKFFSKSKKVLGLFEVYKEKINKTLCHSCFIYAKNVVVDEKYFIDPITCYIEYGDADAAKFCSHKKYIKLNKYFPLTCGPLVVKNEYFHHVDSVSIEMNWYSADVIMSKDIRIDSDFPAALGQIYDNNTGQIIETWNGNTFIYGNQNADA